MWHFVQESRSLKDKKRPLRTSFPSFNSYPDHSPSYVSESELTCPYLQAEERVTLRERIARLESLLSNESPALPSVFSRKSEPLNMLRDATAEDTASDIELPANNLDRRAPFVSALDNADVCLAHFDGLIRLIRFTTEAEPLGIMTRKLTRESEIAS